MFKQQSSGGGNANDDFAKFILAIFIVIMAIVLLLAVGTTFLGGYLLYWSWNANDERRVQRSTTTFFSYGFLLSSLWYGLFFSFPNFFLKAAYFLTKVVGTPEALFKVIALPYLILMPLPASLAVAYFYYKRRPPQIGSYEGIRELVLLLTMPTRLAAKVYSFLPKKAKLSYAVSILAATPVILFVPVAMIVVGEKYHLPWLGYLLGTAYLILGLYAIFANSKSETAWIAKLMGTSKNAKSIVIGRIVKPTIRNLKLSWKDINHHIHILGQPGSGKSVLLRNLYAHQIQEGNGLMMIDLKADFQVKEEIQSLVKSVNREKDLFIIDLSRPHKSCGYNPLLRGNASELKDKIMSSLDWSEEFYKKRSEKVLLLIMKSLVVLRDVKHLTPTLRDVLECLTYPEAIEVLAAELPEGNIEEKNELRDLHRELKDKMSFAELTGVRTDLEVMVKAEFGEILNKPDAIDILDAILTKKIIFIELDGQTYQETAVRIGRMLIADLRAASGAIVSQLGSADRPKFTVIIDEFADIITNEKMGESFVGFLNRCRGSGIGVIMAHQSLGDFVTPKMKTQILDSAETIFSFVQKDPESCEILASVLGTKEALSVTEQTDSFLFMKEKTGRGTQKLTHEYIFHPNEFKNLNVGEAIYIAKKPSRYGKLQVRNIEVPKLNADFVAPSFANNGGQKAMLDLKERRHQLGSLSSVKGILEYEKRFADVVHEADI